MHQSIHAVILNFNGHKLTQACLESLGASLRPIARTIIVDNGSDPEDADALAQAASGIPDTCFLRNDRNEGFAAGTNIGIRKALESGATHVLIINNDATLAPDCLGLLADSMDERSAAAAGPCIYYSGEPSRIWQSYGGFGIWRAGLSVPEKNTLAPPGKGSPRATDYLCGCVLLVKREAFERVGLFDPAYFMYMEDMDLCRRIKGAGFGLIYVPAASAWHKIESAALNRTSEFVLYNLAKSRLIFIRKHFSFPYTTYALIVHFLAHTPFKMLQVLSGSRSLRAALAWFGGTWDGLRA